MDPRRHALPRRAGFSLADGGGETGSDAGPVPKNGRARVAFATNPVPLVSTAAPAGFGKECGAGPHLEWVAATRVEEAPSRVGGHRWHGRERRYAVTPNSAQLVTSKPSPAPEPRPASRTGPTGPILRANPYPEVTDLICRLPLPTLVYRPEASYLGDRLRIWVRTGPKLGCLAQAACVRVTPPRSGKQAAADPRGSPHAVTCLACFTDRQWYAGRRKNRGALRQTVLPTPFRSASGF